MKEKEKLIKALKEIFDELGTWISINDLFLIVNNEYKFTNGISKTKITSALSKNAECLKISKNHETFYFVKRWYT